MKKCQDIENLLPLYPEGALTDAEKRAVEEHLSSCTICRKELANLEKTHQLVAGLPEVEEPPWFRQKIMAQVRKEAEKKSLARKWFYPLRIRIPLQIMATIVIAVLAVYIYRSGENSMNQMLPGVRPPAVEMQKKDAEPPQQSAPQMSAPPGPSAKTVVRREAGQGQETRKQRAGNQNVPEPAVPEIKRQPSDATEAGPARDSAAKMSEKLPEASHSGEKISVKDDIAPSVQAVPQEQKAAKAEIADREDKAEERGYFRMAKKKEAKKATAPAAPRSMASAVDNGMPSLSVSLSVRDIKTAAAAVEKMLTEYDAKISSRQISGEKAVLQIILPAKHTATVLARMKDVGQVHEKTHLYDIKDQNILMIIEIVPF